MSRFDKTKEIPMAKITPFIGKEKSETVPTKDFGDAMRFVSQGYHLRRLEWEDERVMIALIEDKLMIFLPKDGKFHPFIVNSGDLYGNDWVIVNVTRKYLTSLN